METSGDARGNREGWLMSLQANALLTLNELKGFLTIDEAEAEYDSNLEDLINHISDLFDCYTKRTLKSATHTEYLDGRGDDTLHITHPPINETTSSVFVYIDMENLFGEETKVASTDFRVYPEIGKIVLINNTFPEWSRVAKIVYYGGYITIPGDIRIAAKETCAFFRKRALHGLIGVSSVSDQQGSVNVYETELPNTVKGILGRYRRW
jgi:hypothetical protein